MANNSIVVTARIDASLSKMLDGLAARMGHSRSSLVQRAFARFVEKGSEFGTFARNGIDAADRGALISQEEMEAWFERRHLKAAAE